MILIPLRVTRMYVFLVIFLGGFETYLIIWCSLIVLRVTLDAYA